MLDRSIWEFTHKIHKSNKEFSLDSCIKEFDNWSGMNDYARMQLFEKTMNSYCDSLGIKNKPKLHWDDPSDTSNFYGKYSSSENAIFIRLKNRSTKKENFDNPYKALETIIHESNHAYQNACINDNLKDESFNKYNDQEIAWLKSESDRNSRLEDYNESDSYYKAANFVMENTKNKNNDTQLVEWAQKRSEELKKTGDSVDDTYKSKIDEEKSNLRIEENYLGKHDDEPPDYDNAKRFRDKAEECRKKAEIYKNSRDNYYSISEKLNSFSNEIGQVNGDGQPQQSDQNQNENQQQRSDQSQNEEQQQGNDREQVNSEDKKLNEYQIQRQETEKKTPKKLSIHQKPRGDEMEGQPQQSNQNQNENQQQGNDQSQNEAQQQGNEREQVNGEDQPLAEDQLQSQETEKKTPIKLNIHPKPRGDEMEGQPQQSDQNQNENQQQGNDQSQNEAQQQGDEREQVNGEDQPLADDQLQSQEAEKKTPIKQNIHQKPKGNGMEDQPDDIPVESVNQDVNQGQGSQVPIDYDKPNGFLNDSEMDSEGMEVGSMANLGGSYADDSSGMDVGDGGGINDDGGGIDRNDGGMSI